MRNTNFTPQISKVKTIEGFGEDIGQLSLGVYASHLSVSLLYMISQEVVSSLNMSHLFMKDWIFGYWDGTSVIAHEENSLKPHSKVSHGVHYPKNHWAAASSSYILSLGGGLCKWEKIQENDKSHKCSFNQSHNPQNQHQKSQQDQGKKR
jgi:zinc transporter ZupT